MTPSRKDLDIIEKETLNTMYSQYYVYPSVWEACVELLIDIRLTRCMLDDNWTWLEKIRKGIQ